MLWTCIDSSGSKSMPKKICTLPFTLIHSSCLTLVSTDSIEFLQHQEQVQKITDILKTAKVLVTKDHTWVSVNDKPMLADSPDMEKMFSGKPGVHFVITELPRRQGTRKPLGRGERVCI